jgi:hypothetical protein
VVPTPDDEEATVEYDLDEEDEDWLQHHCQVSHASTLSQNVHCLKHDIGQVSCTPAHLDLQGSVTHTKLTTGLTWHHNCIALCLILAVSDLA